MATVRQIEGETGWATEEKSNVSRHHWLRAGRLTAAITRTREPRSAAREAPADTKRKLTPGGSDVTTTWKISGFQKN